MLRSWWRPNRPGLPTNWQDILSARSAQWGLLDSGERDLLGSRAEFLLRAKRWEAARGTTLDDEVRTLVAAHAGLVVLGLDESWFDSVGTIVVRRGAMRRPAPVPGWGRVAGVVQGSPSPVDGEAHHGNGPVMVNWTSARREAANPRWGRDVVIHEFVHKLDMRDGVVDGTPPIDDDAARQRWIEVCTAEFESVRAGSAGPPLRPYAATNPGEFFAVASESFFTRPIELAVAKPNLYAVLRAFYAQDPAARVARSRPAQPRVSR